MIVTGALLILMEDQKTKLQPMQVENCVKSGISCKQD